MWQLPPRMVPFTDSVSCPLRVENVECSYSIGTEVFKQINCRHYLIQHCTTNNKRTFANYAPSYIFRPLQGHHLGGIYKCTQVQQIISNMCVCRFEIQYGSDDYLLLIEQFVGK
jgi:hypothetical protein